MRMLSTSVLAVLLSLGIAPAWAEAGIQQKQIQFAKGQSGATVSGKIKGDQTIDHQLRANAGQTLTVDFKPGKPSAYFNILPPGSDGEALFIGSTTGNHFQGDLSADGVYTLRVYLMGSAKTSDKEVGYTLKVNVSSSHGGGATSNGKASGLAPGSYAEIVGVKGELGLLSGPAMSEQAVGHVGKGRLVKVLKCEPNDGLWCEVEAHNDKSLHGWVKGQNLHAK
ncbi:MAG: hypothetical protein ACOYMG_04515 [Candidatus Methylumidiphilus sp.]